MSRPSRSSSSCQLSLLRTAREVRNALAYVLLNARKHWKQRARRAPPGRLDEASSGFWFEGWRRSMRGPTPSGPTEVSDPHTYPCSAVMAEIASRADTSTAPTENADPIIRRLGWVG